jgi:hypothetical protein
MFNKNKELKVEFFSTLTYLNDIEECRPRPLSQAIPEWWKLAKPTNEQRTIKDCPSFIDLFKNAYVIPMWCDTTITSYPDGTVDAKFSYKEFQWDFHGNNQFLDFAPPHVRDNTSIVLKADSPWYMKTPKGYSVYQTSAFYDFNPNFSVMPGIIHTDFHHEVNQQIMLNGKENSFTIKRGDPFAVYIPFKRDKFTMETRTATKEDTDSLYRNKFKLFTKNKNGYETLFKELNN